MYLKYAIEGVETHFLGYLFIETLSLLFNEEEFFLVLYPEKLCEVKDQRYQTFLLFI